MNKNSDALTLPNNALVLQSMIQTLDYYKDRQYKGLTFADKKQVQKVKMGKIGIASQYHPLS